MNIGDIRMELPTMDSELMLADRQKRKCEVTYIHPEYRFYTVEFTTERGQKFRETFYFRDRDPSGPELPEHIRRQREPAMGLSTDKNTNKMNAHLGNWQ